MGDGFRGREKALQRILDTGQIVGMYQGGDGRPQEGCWLVSEHGSDARAEIAYGTVGSEDPDDIRGVLDEGAEVFFLVPQGRFGTLTLGHFVAQNLVGVGEIGG